MRENTFIMKKLMPVMLAVAIVAVAAIAIFTSGNVLSFDRQGAGNPIGETANSAKPLNFVDSETRYFGPDFMCLIYGNTSRIECIGSDTDGVMSDVPAGTGFTVIDGGDTYACAYHEAERFTYCWGSITRRPTTVQPTVEPTIEPTIAPTVDPTIGPTVEPTTEPTVEPTVEPTAEPTVEPTPVATNQCDVRLSDSADGTFSFPVTKNEEWIEECVYILDDLTNLLDNDDIPVGDRYYRVDDFSVSNAMTLVATLESDEDTVMLLWEYELDGDGDIIDDSFRLVEANDDIASGGVNTNSRFEWKAATGKYYLLDLTTYKLNTLGDFTLTLEKGAGSSSQSLGNAEVSDVAIPSNLRR